ncbi:MAG: sensor histidine kinase, partial [Nonomuraea sp.]|nr:sensor histidine kinase [Nonomuraea sp.]
MEYLVGVVVVAVLLGVPSIVLWRVMRGRRELGTSPAERATFETLHTASLAGPPLRAGLTAEGAERASRHLRALLGSAAVA